MRLWKKEEEEEEGPVHPHGYGERVWGADLLYTLFLISS